MLSQLGVHMKIEIIGVYPVRARQPCHLVELWVRELIGRLPVAEFTQEIQGKSQANWQVPWDERVLTESGSGQEGKRFPRHIEADQGDVRLAFFFHYLDLSKPLLTPAGPLQLPEATKMPSRLKFFKYESPC